MDCSLPGSSIRGMFSGKGTGLGYHSLLQGMDIPNLGMKPRSSTLQADDLPHESPGKPNISKKQVKENGSNVESDLVLQCKVG